MWRKIRSWYYQQKNQQACPACRKSAGDRAAMFTCFECEWCARSCHIWCAYRMGRSFLTVVCYDCVQEDL